MFISSYSNSIGSVKIRFITPTGRIIFYVSKADPLIEIWQQPEQKLDIRAEIKILLIVWGRWFFLCNKLNVALVQNALTINGD